MDLNVLWTIACSMGTVSDLKMLGSVRDFNIKIVTADRVDKDSAGFVFAGKRYMLPCGSDREYINRVMHICKAEGITTIIPQYTDELEPLSLSSKVFEDRGIKVLVTEDTEKLRIANNKKDLYNFFGGSSIVPRYKCVSFVNDLEEALYCLGYPDNPVCIKPVYGEGGKGFRIVTEEKVDIFNESADSKVSLSILKEQLKSVKQMPELIVMEYLPGSEYSVDCICKNGVTYLCIPRQRIETSMGAATVSVIEKNDEIISYTKDIISSLNLSYNINVQFKLGCDGQPKLIEVNPRVSGSLVANLGAGVNMLEKSLRLAYGMEIGDVDVKWGTKMFRYWDQLFR